MKQKSFVSLGPGASSLILIFVVLSMAVLGMLSLMTSQNDLRLSERNVQVTEAVYALNASAEHRRAEIDSILIRCTAQAQNESDYLKLVRRELPDGMELEDGIIFWMESDEGRILECALKLFPPDSDRRSTWVRYNLSAETEDSWNW